MFRLIHLEKTKTIIYGKYESFKNQSSFDKPEFPLIEFHYPTQPFFTFKEGSATTICKHFIFCLINLHINNGKVHEIGEPCDWLKCD